MKISELIARIQAGDSAREAEAELYQITSKALLERLRRKITRRLQPRLDAEDVLNEAFLRALGALDRFHGAEEDAFLRWTYRIAKNSIADQNKRRSVNVRPIVQGDGTGGPRASQIMPRNRRSPESDLLRKEFIESLLGRLKPKEAEVIRLKRIHEYSFEEIADGWKKSPGAVQRFYQRSWRRFCEIANLEGE